MTMTGTTSCTVVPTALTSVELRVARSPVPTRSTTETGRPRTRDTKSSRSSQVAQSPDSGSWTSSVSPGSGLSSASVS